MSDMVPTGSKYTDDQRVRACIEYQTTGSFKKTSKALSMPATTLQQWAKQDWWVELSVAVQSENTQQHRAKYSKILDLAQDRMIEDLPNATAQQASIVGGVAFDKLRLIDNQPTSITGKAESMNSMAKEFRKLSAKWDNMKVVSTQDDTQPIDK